MSFTYPYTRTLVNGSYDTHARTLAQEITAALPGLDFSIQCGGVDVNFIFTLELSAGNETILTNTFNAHVVPVKKAYKIYGCMSGSFDDTKPPITVNYKTGLTMRLQPKRTFVAGVLTEVLYYAVYDGTTFSGPIIKETIAYNYNASNLATDRTMDLQWYYDDGTIGPVSKTLLKYYSDDESVIESKRRRTNILNKIQLEIVGLVMLTEGITQAAAIVEGSNFFNTDHEVINSWLDTPALGDFQASLAAEVDGVTSWQWLFNDISADYAPGVSYMLAVLGENVTGVVTIKDYIENQINY